MNTKSIFIILCLMSMVLLVSNHQVFSQDKEVMSYDKKNFIKLNLISPILSSFSMAYERVTSPNQSFQMTFFLQDQRMDYTYQDRLKSFGMVSEYRFYLSEYKEAPAGIFIAPFLSYRHYEADYEDYNYDTQTVTQKNDTYDNIGLGVTIGAQWVFKQKISLDVWGGTGYGIGMSSEDTNPDSYNYFGSFPYQKGGGFLGRVGATVGIAF